MVPVDGLRGEFFRAGGFDGVDPACKRAEEPEESVLELVGWNYPGRPRRLADLHGRSGLERGVDGPGMGSFPCLFRNAEYALMNF